VGKKQNIYANSEGNFKTWWTEPLVMDMPLVLIIIQILRQFKSYEKGKRFLAGI
jgi:hypothetical protein